MGMSAFSAVNATKEWFQESLLLRHLFVVLARKHEYQKNLFVLIVLRLIESFQCQMMRNLKFICMWHFLLFSSIYFFTNQVN